MLKPFINTLICILLITTFLESADPSNIAFEIKTKMATGKFSLLRSGPNLRFINDCSIPLHVFDDSITTNGFCSDFHENCMVYLSFFAYLKCKFNM